MGIGLDRLLGGSHLLKALGLDNDGLFGQLNQLTEQGLPLLAELGDSFQMACGMPPAMLAGMLQSGGIGPQLFMPPPNMGGCMCPGHYAQPQTFDFGASGGFPFSPGALLARHQGAKFERMLERNPFARAQFEMAVGGRIVPDGCRDGRITVQPFAQGFFPAGGAENLPFGAAQAMFAQMQRAAGYSQGYQAGMAQSGGGLFQGMMLGGLQQVLQQALAGGGLPGLPGLPGLGAGGGVPQAFTGAPAFGGAVPQTNYAGGANQAALGLNNPSPFQAGQANATQPAFGLGQNDGSDVSAVLADNSLTVEDKVCLMIMLIMKKMDEDIEKMANDINKLQQQQNKQGGGGGKGGGKGGGGGGGGGDKSIDVETMKLKRLIDKRSQMFDMLRQIIDKYNQTAKGIIDSIGR